MHFLARIATTALAVAFVLFNSAAAFTNPVRRPGGSDPFMVYAEGYYYLITTSFDNLQLARAKTVEGLKTAPKKLILEEEVKHQFDIWAAEIHFLDGKWYLYYAANGVRSIGGQRLHVLTGGASPWDDYTYTGPLTTEWAIDPTVVRFKTFGNYIAFACFHGTKPQSLCMQKLAPSNTALTGDIGVISQPTKPYEVQGAPVNEGPSALYWGGKTYLTFSASDCWTAFYCLGLLTWDGATDPLKADAWTKSDDCVLSKANENYGTGHNSFFTNAKSSETWIAFHATSNPLGACDDSRYTMVQQITAGVGGAPEFGTPLPLNQVISGPDD